jgi:hypothetical protein
MADPLFVLIRLTGGPNLPKLPPTRQPQESLKRIVGNQVGSLTSLVYVYLYLCPYVWMSI